MGIDISHKPRSLGVMEKDIWLVKDLIHLGLFVLFIFDALLSEKLLSSLDQKSSYSNTCQCSPKIGKIYK